MASNYNGNTNGGVDTIGIGGIGGPVPSTTATAIDGVTQSTTQAPARRPVRTLFFFDLRNPIRQLCICIVEWKVFEHIILLTIFANCIAFIFTLYPSGDSNKTNMSLEKVENIFMFIFTLECAIKIIAFGFVMHQGSYLRNGWNILDFWFVVIGILGTVLQNVMPDGFDVKALRAFRVLRSLRLVSGVPCLQVVLDPILRVVVPLLHIALLAIFVIIIYAIIGFEFFSGKHHAISYKEHGGEIIRDPQPYSTEPNIGYKCPVEDNDRYQGITSFHNFGLAMLTVFQYITPDRWTEVLYWIQDTFGNIWQWIYFVSMVILGAFYAMNLILDVLSR